jgi:segregation and condensation protein B
MSKKKKSALEALVETASGIVEDKGVHSVDVAETEEETVTEIHARSLPAEEPEAVTAELDEDADDEDEEDLDDEESEDDESEEEDAEEESEEEESDDESEEDDEDEEEEDEDEEDEEEEEDTDTKTTKVKAVKEAEPVIELTPEQQAEREAENARTMRLLEAILFASAEPVPLSVLKQQIGENVDLPALLTELQTTYAEGGVNLVDTDGVWSFRTAVDLAGILKITRNTRRKLPRAAAEVLAIIAYHQPVTRGEVESIRGVETSRGTLDILLELGWIRPGKRRETPGQPLNWHTTTEFLSHFNITSLTELPGLDDLKAAGLLDTRPVLDSLAREKDTDQGVADDSDEDFAAWIKEEPEAVAV